MSPGPTLLRTWTLGLGKRLVDVVQCLFTVAGCNCLFKSLSVSCNYAYGVLSIADKSTQVKQCNINFRFLLSGYT